MKITRTPHVRSSEAAGKPRETSPAKGKAFAEKLAKAERTADAAGAPERTAAARSASAVADIGAGLKAGRLTPEAAIAKVVEHVLERQLGKTASPALRAQLAASLRESLTDDPLLAAKIRALAAE
jgi:hypothetical protein